MGMPLSRATSSGPIGRSPSTDWPPATFATEIDIGAAGVERRIDAIFLEGLFSMPAEVASVLDALDPRQLKRQRLRALRDRGPNVEPPIRAKYARKRRSSRFQNLRRVWSKLASILISLGGGAVVRAGYSSERNQQSEWSITTTRQSG
jgi:hypothetical protein